MYIGACIKSDKSLQPQEGDPLTPLEHLQMLLGECKLAPLSKEEEEELREASLKELQRKIAKYKQMLANQAANDEKYEG